MVEVAVAAPVVPVVKIGTWEHLVVHLYAWRGKILSLLDRNRDGKWSSEDLIIILAYLKGLLIWCAVNVPGWAAMTKGQKIDKLGESMAIAFPTVPGTVWMLLEGLAHAGLVIYEGYAAHGITFGAGKKK